MSFVRYTAQRSLIPASPSRLNTSFDFQLKLIGLTRARKVNRRDVESLSGKRESTYFSGLATWQTSTRAVQIGGVESDQLIEFLDSVEAGESFSFDPYGDVGDSPDQLRSVTLTSRGYSERRVVKRGGTGATDFVSYAFTMIESP